jgi:hypothetical protein
VEELSVAQPVRECFLVEISLRGLLDILVETFSRQFDISNWISGDISGLYVRNKMRSP